MNSTKLQRPSRQSQRGGFAVGLIIGLLIGLALALGVALYVTKVPVPFINKVPQRTAGQDAAETEKNKNWDPNSPLYGKNPARPNNAASGSVAPLPAPPTAAVNPPTTSAGIPATTPSTRASSPSAARDPAAILANQPAPAPPPKLAAAASGPAGPEPFSYFVQAGAYGRTEDAEQQRAKLAMMGMEGKLSEREQSGRTVYRVRVGPFDKKADAEAAKDRLASSGVEAALVRVQR
jgi:cell division protein FtsN